MTLKNDTLFWKKKEFISFLLSILVLFIHSYFAQDIGDGSLASVINHKVSYFSSMYKSKSLISDFSMLSGIGNFFKSSIFKSPLWFFAYFLCSVKCGQWWKATFKNSFRYVFISIFIEFIKLVIPYHVNIIGKWHPYFFIE